MVAVSQPIVTEKPADAKQMLVDGEALEKEAMARVEKANLLDSDALGALREKRSEFAAIRNKLSAMGVDYIKTHSALAGHLAALEKLLKSAEELGDSAVEDLQRTPDAPLSWNGGLNAKWQAADGTMEAYIALLRRAYFYQRRINNTADAVKGLDDSLVWLRESMTRIIEHPLFQTTPLPEGYEGGRTYAEVLASALQQHIDDFYAALGKLESVRNDQSAIHPDRACAIEGDGESRSAGRQQGGKRGRQYR
ncbi:MAG: hypothetical protein U1F68_04525 [Gammaproteobacteria bacterium]